MEVALLTVGDELLDGDTENTNATWLASALTDRGVSVQRVLVVPDDRGTITDCVRSYSDAFDAVIVTGGIGGTPDDVTMEAVADAFDREMTVSDLALADIEGHLEDLDAEIPDLDLDIEAEASVPTAVERSGARAGMCRRERLRPAGDSGRDAGDVPRHRGGVLRESAVGVPLHGRTRGKHRRRSGRRQGSVRGSCGLLS